MKLVYIVTHPITAQHLLRGQLAFMKQQGFETILITSPGPQLEEILKREGVSIYPIPMEREINLLKDAISLIHLFRLIRKIRPQIVNAGTPKAGLLGMVSSWLARVPVRIYLLRGLRLETKNGFALRVLKTTERIASWCSTRVICVSESLRQRCASLGLVRESKTLVLLAGSSNGVDAKRFGACVSEEQKRTLRLQLNIPETAPVVGFVGRLTRDKGVSELFSALDLLGARFPDIRLLILGDWEDGDPVSQNLVQSVVRNERIIKAGFVQDTVEYYALMDVLAFPSYREGFPNVPLEAGACGVPSVAFAVTGSVDAIQDGISGKLVQPFDVKAFADAIACYLSDPRLKRQHGAAARERAVHEFSQEKLWTALKVCYQELLNSSN